MRNAMKAFQFLPVVPLFLGLTLGSALAQSTALTGERVKDLASVAGVRSNQLVGYGIVVGLNGTGDGNVAAMLHR